MNKSKAKIFFFLGFVFFLLPSALFSAGEQYSIVKTVFLPPVYYVGDEVELRLILKVDAGVEISPSDLNIDSGWLKINDLQASPKGDDYEVVCRFTPFSTGTRTLPALPLGGISLEGIKVHTNSLVEERNADFVEIQGQYFLGSTKLILGIFVAVLLVGPLFFILFSGKIRRKLSSLYSDRKRKRPYKRLLRELSDLGDAAEKWAGKDFYISLVGVLRTYLTERSGVDFATATTEDFPRLVMRAVPSVSNLPDLLPILKYADEIKFGGKRAPRSKKLSDLKDVEEMASIIEECFLFADEVKKEGVSSGRRK